MLGADAKALEAGIIKHLGNISSDEPTEETDSQSSAVLVPGQVHSSSHFHLSFSLFQINLNSVIDISGSECLNESDGHNYKNALTSGSGYLESDCDEQVMDE